MEELHGRPEVATPPPQCDVPLETLSIAVFRASAVERASSFYAALEQDCLPLRNVVTEEENSREGENFFNTIQEIDRCQNKVYKNGLAADQSDDNSRREALPVSDGPPAQVARGSSVSAETFPTDNAQGTQGVSTRGALVLASGSSDDDSGDEDQGSDSTERSDEGSVISGPVDLDFPVEALMGLAQNLSAITALRRAVGQRSGPEVGTQQAGSAPPHLPPATGPPQTAAYPEPDPFVQLLQSNLQQQMGGLAVASPNRPGNTQPSDGPSDNPEALIAALLSSNPDAGEEGGNPLSVSAEQPPNPLAFLSSFQDILSQQAASPSGTNEAGETLPPHTGQAPGIPNMLFGNVGVLGDLQQQVENPLGDPMALFTSMVGAFQGQMPGNVEAVPGDETRSDAEEALSREPSSTQHTARAPTAAIEGTPSENENVQLVPQETTPTPKFMHQESDERQRAVLGEQDAIYGVTRENVEESDRQSPIRRTLQTATGSAGETFGDVAPPARSRDEGGAPSLGSGGATPHQVDVDPQSAAMLAMLQGLLQQISGDPNMSPEMVTAINATLEMHEQLARGDMSEQDGIATMSRVVGSLDHVFDTLNTPAMPPPLRGLLGSTQNMMRGVHDLLTVTSEAMGEGGDQEATTEGREERLREAENEFVGVFTRNMEPMVDFSEQMVHNLQQEILGSDDDSHSDASSNSSSDDDQLDGLEQGLFAMADKRVTGEVRTWQAHLVQAGRGARDEHSWSPVYLMSCDKLHRVVEQDNPAHRVNPTAPFFDTSTTTPGFTKIKATMFLNNDNSEQPNEEMGGPTFETKIVLTGSLSHLEKLSRLHNWGEGILFQDKLACYERGSIQAALVCDSWPSFLQDVFERPRGSQWPPLEALQALGNLPPLVQPLQRDSSGDDTWQFVFHSQMLYLLSQVPASAAHAYDAFQRLSRAAIQTVTDTVLLTVLFRWLEKKWTPDMNGIEGVGPCFLGLFDALLEVLESRSVPHFFIPQINLLREANEMVLQFSYTTLAGIRRSLKDLEWVEHFSSVEKAEDREENIAKVIEFEAEQLFENYLEWIYPKKNDTDTAADKLQASMALKALQSLSSAAQAIRILTTLDSFHCGDETSLFTLVERIGCHCFQQRSTFPLLGTTRDLWQYLGEQMFGLLMRQEYPSPGLVVEQANVLVSLQRHEEAERLIPAITMATPALDSLLATWSNWYDASLCGILDPDVASLLRRWTSVRVPSLVMVLYLRCRCLLARGESPSRDIRRLHDLVRKISQSTDERDKERLAASLKLLAFVVAEAGFARSAVASHTAADKLARHVGLCV